MAAYSETKEVPLKNLKNGQAVPKVGVKVAVSAGRVSTLPGLWKYPSGRDTLIRSDTAWLAGRRQDDGAEGLWRIHDTLYDFSSFIDRHPGGAEWLEITKGTDITEAFEAHHISPMPAGLLAKFVVRTATTRRNSPYTFHEDGFYATLRRRVFAILLEANVRGPSMQSRIIVDSLVVATFLSAVSAAVLQSICLAVLAGVLVAFSTGAAHNFLHLKHNWRRYYFHLSLLSARHWGVIHALSHHLYPNSIHDLEISMIEPWLQYLPSRDKDWRRYFSWVIFPIVYALICPLEYLRYIVSHGLTLPDMIPLSIPVLMVAVNQLALVSAVQVTNTLLLWLYIVITGSVCFVTMGLNTGHHHPEIFHDGDTPRGDRDWGLAQLDSVRDRTSVSGVQGHLTSDEKGQLVVHINTKNSENMFTFFLSLTNFGHHVLHHLFPSVDSFRLLKLYPVLEQTLTQFGVPFETTSAFESIKGQFLQLVKNEPNPLPPEAKYICKYKCLKNLKK